MDATDLTQLSSREQLSALMDGALPADETRFLLRRLQHDAPLAECWERWRLSAEVMRGLAPTQRLQADFAARVAASLRAGDLHGEGIAGAVAVGKRGIRTPAWLHWGGGAAVAASLAVAALMTQPVAVESPATMHGNSTVAAAPAQHDDTNETLAVANARASRKPAPQAPEKAPAGAGLDAQTAMLASAVAVVARPARNTRRSDQPSTMQVPASMTASSDTRPADAGVAVAIDIQPVLPRSDIISRPWPRSVLPHYGNTGITVGFADSTRNAAPYNPFPLRTGIGNLPPALIADSPTGDVATPANDETGGTANSDPQR